MPACFSLPLVFLALASIAAAADAWLGPDDVARLRRTGEWRVTRHRYAADAALATTQDGAALELTFQGRELVLCLDTLTPPNNYGPPELGALEVFVDGVKRTTIRPRDAANEIVLLRSPGDRPHAVRVVHRREAAGAGARVRGFRVGTEPAGELAFVVSGEQHGALIDLRAIVRREARVVRDALVRNWLTGECRLAGLPPGDGYSLELRAAGWEQYRAENISVAAERETRLDPIYLRRPHDVEQDAFTFPAPGHPIVRQAGGTFRARFEAPNAEIRAARIVRQVGPATVSRACRFEEDRAAAFYYHREGTLTIPADAPPGTYDLELTIGGGERGVRTLTSPRCVAVVTAFPAEPTFVAWGHLDTWGQYQAEYVEQLVAIANLVAPDMVLVSNEANPAYAAGALRGLEAPFVINFGNHRGPDPGPWFGAPVTAVDFGSAFTVLNFGHAWDRDLSHAETLLTARAATRLKIINAFESNAPVAFLDRHRVALIHYAHGPGPAIAKLGATPTLRVGKRSSESFRVIRFRGGVPVAYAYSHRGDATAGIPFPRGAKPPLGLAFEPANDGTQRTITARFHNELDEAFPNAVATFVLPRGEYRVDRGRIERSDPGDGGAFTLLRVRFDLPARTSGSITVQPN